MDLNTVLTAILIAVFIIVGIALAMLLLQLVKLMKSADAAVKKIEPTLDHVEVMANDMIPVVKQIDPMMERVQLTLDSVNLEMMRVDQILEDVTEITNAAASATSAVDNITSAPVKAVSNAATKMRLRFGGKSASQESAQLAEQRAAVAQALKDYEAAEAKKSKSSAPSQPAAETAEEKQEPVLTGADAAPLPESPKSYVKEVKDGEELVIDPKAIAESPFFEDDAK